ncbi:MAG: universal stress protein [Synergistota bacterium]|nr:universal stress protein [Synergistota bacterium]
MPRKMLVPVSMGPLAQHLVEYGHSLAYRLNVEVSFAHILPDPKSWMGYDSWIPASTMKPAEESARKKILYWITKAEEDLPELPRHEHKIFFDQGQPAEAIIRIAKKNGDNLIVMGFRSTSSIKTLVLGSTATMVARHAHCSVMIYRPGFDPFE